VVTSIKWYARVKETSGGILKTIDWVEENCPGWSFFDIKSKDGPLPEIKSILSLSAIDAPERNMEYEIYFVQEEHFAIFKLYKSERIIASSTVWVSNIPNLSWGPE
jgi:hypothetical protein